MLFRQILHEDLSCASYMVGCLTCQECAVIDPRLDAIDYYVEMAQAFNLHIAHIIGSHITADHLSGDVVLAKQTGARVHYYNNPDIQFEYEPLKDGQEIVMGNVVLKILYTPGHTFDSICVVVTDHLRSKDPWVVLTGDTLLVGDIGRPDLEGADLAKKMANLINNSLRTKVMKLPDYMEVYPAHYSGSLCGRFLNPKPVSTIGYERRNNYMIKLLNKKTEFIKTYIENLPPKPDRFLEIIERNLKQSWAGGETPTTSATAEEIATENHGTPTEEPQAVSTETEQKTQPAATAGRK